MDLSTASSPHDANQQKQVTLEEIALEVLPDESRQRFELRRMSHGSP
jgi:hypothetical protein